MQLDGFSFIVNVIRKDITVLISVKGTVLWFCHYFMFCSIFEAVSQNLFSILWQFLEH